MLMVSSAFRVLLVILLRSLVLTLVSSADWDDHQHRCQQPHAGIQLCHGVFCQEEFHQLLLRQAVILPDVLTQTVPLILDSIRFNNPPDIATIMCHNALNLGRAIVLGHGLWHQG